MGRYNASGEGIYWVEGMGCERSGANGRECDGRVGGARVGRGAERSRGDGREGGERGQYSKEGRVLVYGRLG